ncbi:MAG: L-seryl-tRNA(Sec) selenium transferase [Proteobacteria bacterium]|nr:L-seryl-tRNA(Sec) selenium transferase [Pseudomonadota bacterium]
MVRKQQLLRQIPKVDEVLNDPEISRWIDRYSRGVVVEAVRQGLQRLRDELLSSTKSTGPDGKVFSLERLMPYITEAIDHLTAPRLKQVINATGVVIHTNLGRSILHGRAIEHMGEVSRRFSNLEYDIERGQRGSRYVHVEEILCTLTGAEAALVVNNNAGAVLLVLNTLAEGREVVVSRGQLVEIGGAFRIPDVMRRSGAHLVEVGTTNRTRLEDYHRAISEETALLLKVHTSNFKIVGFTAEVSLRDLAELGKSEGIPVMEDLGSGCLVDLTPYGLEEEPLIQESIKGGADVVTFSGDKLLGGPQAGVILGKEEIVSRVRANPLHRAVRVDKLTLAALESTLRIYLDRDKALQEIPTLAMLTVSRESLNRKARRLMAQIRRHLGDGVDASVRDDRSQVGGGAYPIQELPTRVVSIRSKTLSANQIEEKLRRQTPPVITRINRDEVVLDLRTIQDDEIPILAQALSQVLA